MKGLFSGEGQRLTQGWGQLPVTDRQEHMHQTFIPNPQKGS